MFRTLVILEIMAGCHRKECTAVHMFHCPISKSVNKNKLLAVSDSVNFKVVKCIRSLH